MRRKRVPRLLAAAVSGLLLAAAVLPLPVGTNTEAYRNQWTLLVNHGASANLIADEKGDFARVEVARLKSRKPYEVRLERPVHAKQGAVWRVRFQVRSNNNRTMVCRLVQGAAPWGELAPARSFPVSTSWSETNFQFVSAASEPDARIQFWMGDNEGMVELKDVVIDPAASPGTAR